MAIDEIILHIGMHKTGTSSIQHALAGFDDGRTVYADLRTKGYWGPNHGIALETIYRAGVDKIPHHIHHGRSRAQIEAMRPALRRKLTSALANDAKALIFSGEAIPRLTREQLRDFATDLQRAARRVRVIAYLRDPHGFCSAILQEQLKTAKLPRDGGLTLPRYKRKFAKFRRVFGAENVTFKDYDRSALLNGSVVDDFCAFAGITPPHVDVARNVGLSADATRALFTLAEDPDVICNSPQARQALREVQDRVATALPGPSFRLPKAFVAAHVPAKDIAWVQRVAGFDFGLGVSAHPPIPSLAEAVGPLDDDAARALDDLAGTTGRDPRVAVRSLYDAALRRPDWLHRARQTALGLRFAFGR